MRQPHPEINFRRGKALNRFDPKGFVEACRLVGMTDKQIKEELGKVIAAQVNAKKR